MGCHHGDGRAGSAASIWAVPQVHTGMQCALYIVTAPSIILSYLNTRMNCRVSAGLRMLKRLLQLGCATAYPPACYAWTCCWPEVYNGSITENMRLLGRHSLLLCLPVVADSGVEAQLTSYCVIVLLLERCSAGTSAATAAILLMLFCTG